MKQSKIITAYKEMETLASNNNLTDAEQWDIYQLRKNLREYYKFQQERETTILSKYKDDIDEKGNINGDKAKQFMKDFEELGNREVELKDLTKPRIRNAGINFKTMEILEDFIDFYKAE